MVLIVWVVCELIEIFVNIYLSEEVSDVVGQIVASLFGFWISFYFLLVQQAFFVRLQRGERLLVSQGPNMVEVM